MDHRNFRIAMRVATVTAMFALATAAEAQHSTTHKPVTKASSQPLVPDGRRTGLVLGVYTMAAPGVTLTGDDVDGTFKTNFGPGAGVMVGYGFNRTFSGFASLDLAKQGTSGGDLGGSFGLRHIELGARANLPYGSDMTVPYLTASYGQRALGARVTDNFEGGVQYDMRLSGGMFGVGGGLEHVISPTLAVDGGLAVAFGRFSHGDINGESSSLAVNGTTSIRLRIGMTWRPAPRRG